MAQSVAFGDLGPWQIDEPDGRAELSTDSQRLPLRGEHAERVIGPASRAVGEPDIAVDGDGQFMAEVKLVEPLVVVGRPFDQDGVGPHPLGQLDEHPCAERAMVPDREEHDPGIHVELGERLGDRPVAGVHSR